MRVGVAIDLHATASSAGEVAWRHVREQALLAERLGFDLVVLPDHLAYRTGGEGDYVSPDEPVGVREAVTEAAALAAATSRITVGHSVIDAVYRRPAMLAHIAATLADISDGRYSLGIGVGNSFDYDQLGVDADHRVDRFEECVEIVSGLLHHGHVDVAGTYWSAANVDLAFAPDPERRPPLVVAAGGPRTMRVAARFGDAWNGFAPTDPAGTAVDESLQLLRQACEDIDRDPSSIDRTVDLGIDALDLHGARHRSLETLGMLAERGVDEARCYVLCDQTHAARVEAINALAELLDEL